MIIYIQRSVKNRNIRTQHLVAKITGPSIAIYTYDKIRKTPKETQRDTNTYNLFSKIPSRGSHHSLYYLMEIKVSKQNI